MIAYRVPVHMTHAIRLGDADGQFRVEVESDTGDRKFYVVGPTGLTPVSHTGWHGPAERYDRHGDIGVFVSPNNFFESGSDYRHLLYTVCPDMDDKSVAVVRGQHIEILRLPLPKWQSAENVRISSDQLTCAVLAIGMNRNAYWSGTVVVFDL